MTGNPEGLKTPEPLSLTERAAAPRTSFDADFETVSVEYLKELRRQDRALSTIDVVRRKLRELGLFLQALPQPPRSLADLTPELVAAYRDHEISRGRKWRSPGPLAAATVRLTVAVLKGFFRHLARRGIVLLDPALELKGPKRHRRLPRQVPTPRQMKRLLSSPDEATRTGKRDRAVLELLYSSGIRNAELCGLLVGDVDLSDRTVFVSKGKGGKERQVPMGRKASDAVAAYLSVRAGLSGRLTGREEPLFLGRTGRPLSTDGLRLIVSGHRQRSRLSVSATPHSLRHACATHLLKGGAGIRQIQTLLGHASLSSTEIYTRVETSDLRAMLDRHHPRSVSVEGESNT